MKVGYREVADDMRMARISLSSERVVVDPGQSWQSLGPFGEPAPPYQLLCVDWFGVLQTKLGSKTFKASARLV